MTFLLFRAVSLVSPVLLGGGLVVTASMVPSLLVPPAGRPETASAPPTVAGDSGQLARSSIDGMEEGRAAGIADHLTQQNGPQIETESKAAPAETEATALESRPEQVAIPPTIAGDEHSRRLNLRDVPSKEVSHELSTIERPRRKEIITTSTATSIAQNGPGSLPMRTVRATSPPIVRVRSDVSQGVGSTASPTLITRLSMSAPQMMVVSITPQPQPTQNLVTLSNREERQGRSSATPSR